MMIIDTIRQAHIFRSMDDTGSEMIPIRLLVSVAIIGFISFLLVNGLVAVFNQSSNHQLHKQINELEVSCQVLIESGTPRDISNPFAANGSRRTISFTLPSSLSYISFGGDPDYNYVGDNAVIDEMRSSVFYQFQGSGKEVFWLDTDCKLVKAKMADERWVPVHIFDPLVIDRPGKVTLNFELIKENDGLCILIYP